MFKSYFKKIKKAFKSSRSSFQALLGRFKFSKKKHASEKLEVVENKPSSQDFLGCFKMSKKNKGSEQVKYLPQSAILEEKQSLKLMLSAVLSISLLILALFLWAALTHVDETTVAVGEIVPENKIQVAQHLEGGIISEIFVKNGDFVRKGETLLNFDSRSVIAELDQLRAREFLLLFEAERLRAYTLGETDLSKNYSKLLSEMDDKAITQQKTLKRMLKDEEKLLLMQNIAREEKRAILENQISKYKGSVESLKKQKPSFEAQVALLKKEERITANLRKGELVSENEHLEILRKLTKAQSDLQGTLGDERRTEKELMEAEYRLHESGASLDEVAFQKLVQVTGELLEVQGAIDKVLDKLNRLAIKSPVDGVVKGLNVSIASVISPGFPLLEIVPQDVELIAETQISPRDIGYISKGTLVKVKITTYDFARYGGIEGTLISLSPSTFKNKDGENYYKGIIRLDKQYVGKNPLQRQLIAGMDLQADIITGDKTLLQYLLKPIHMAMTASFNER